MTVVIQVLVGVDKKVKMVPAPSSLPDWLRLAVPKMSNDVQPGTAVLSPGYTLDSRLDFKDTSAGAHPGLLEPAAQSRLLVLVRALGIGLPCSRGRGSPGRSNGVLEGGTTYLSFAVGLSLCQRAVDLDKLLKESRKSTVRLLAQLLEKEPWKRTYVGWTCSGDRRGFGSRGNVPSAEEDPSKGGLKGPP